MYIKGLFILFKTYILNINQYGFREKHSTIIIITTLTLCYKSTGYDNWSLLIINYLVSKFINLAMSEGLVPDELKNATFLLPVHKSNTKDEISNYRPHHCYPQFMSILGLFNLFSPNNIK